MNECDEVEQVWLGHKHESDCYRKCKVDWMSAYNQECDPTKCGWNCHGWIGPRQAIATRSVQLEHQMYDVLDF